MLLTTRASQASALMEGVNCLGGSLVYKIKEHSGAEVRVERRERRERRKGSKDSDIEWGCPGYKRSIAHGMHLSDRKLSNPLQARKGKIM